jgi:hypothetical protein
VKKNSSPFACSILVVVVFLTASCKKNVTPESQRREDAVTFFKQPPPALCDVQSFQLAKNFFELATDNNNAADLNFPQLISAFRAMSNIQYDGQHKPLRASLDLPDSVGQFSYDNGGRLVSFLLFVPAPPPGVTAKYEYFWKFSYGTAVITVSAGYRELTDGNLGNEIITGSADLYLDQSNKVIRRVFADGSYDRYEYNSKSDLLNVFSKPVAGTESLKFQFSGYDNNQCFANTNQTWQLLLNVYSANNPRTVTEVQNNNVVHVYTYQYNSSDLPVSIQEKYNNGTNVVIPSFIQYVCFN